MTNFWEHRKSPIHSVLNIIQKDDYIIGTSLIGMIMEEHSLTNRVNELTKLLILDNDYVRLFESDESVDDDIKEMKEVFLELDAKIMELRNKIADTIENLAMYKIDEIRGEDEYDFN